MAPGAEAPAERSQFTEAGLPRLRLPTVPSGRERIRHPGGMVEPSDERRDEIRGGDHAYPSGIAGTGMFATGAQVVRNMVVLHGLGVGISAWDAIALLIASAALGLLPVGPTLGAATAVLILGANGVAVVAAAGALLTATGAAGALMFAVWALADRLRPSVSSKLTKASEGESGSTAEERV